MNAAPNHEPPSTDQRLTRLEVLVENLVERVLRLDERMSRFESNFATKADVNSAIQEVKLAAKADLQTALLSLIKWIVGTGVVATSLNVMVMTFVLNFASPRGAPAAAMVVPPPAPQPSPAPSKPR